MSSVVEQGAKTNRWPAYMDLIQGATGCFLVLFMWAHMIMVSSILLGEDAMYWVARLFEGEPILGKPYPILVAAFATFILTVVMIHAFFALRRFPASAKQYRTMHTHMKQLKHSDTTMWYVQVITGFGLFFMIAIHLYQLIMHPDAIGPYASSDRVWGTMWPLYGIMLLAVELHAGIGFYRLMMKWGLLLGQNPKRSRTRLHIIKWVLTAFFLGLGVTTLAAYMKIGAAHAELAGERYLPTSHQSKPDK